MTPGAILAGEERAVVEAERIRAFFKETNDQNLAGALVFSLLVYLVSGGIPAWTWQPALLLLYAVTAVRALQIWQYGRHPGRRSPAAWGRGQAIAGGLAGMCWGFASTAMLAHVPPGSQLLILTVITVAAAANASEGFSYPPPSQAFILFCLAPPIAWLLTVEDQMHLILGVMLLIFVPMTLHQANKRSRIFIEAQTFRFRNERLASELAQQRDAAQAAYQAKARFLAAASHDLRQPMQALSIYQELLHKALPPTGSAADLLAGARQAADAMNSILDALLDVSRLDANVVRIDVRPFAIQDLLTEMTHEFGPVAQLQGLRLRVRNCGATVASDRILLGQVLRNLIANAIRYTSAGRVLVGCRRRAGQLEIGVFDTGIGIAPHEQQAIFAEFYQVDNPSRDRKQGLGLGLAIVERTVRLLGHRLILRSVPGRGSCFTVTVPLAVAAVIPPDAPVEPVPEWAGQATHHVLVVDDEEAIRTGLRHLLEGWGYRVTVAGSGAEALERLAEADGPIEAIISDYRLPGANDGIEVIERLRQQLGADLPALLITGDTGSAVLQAARDSGLVLLHKPVKPARLRAALSQVLGG